MSLYVCKYFMICPYHEMNCMNRKISDNCKIMEIISMILPQKEQFKNDK